MKIRSTIIAFSLRQQFYKFRNFSDPILRQFLNSVDEFLPFQAQIIARRLNANWSNS